MKARLGFVSNSSSSSFVINLDDLTPKQVRKIKNHTEVAKNMWSNREWYDDQWSIEENDETIRGYTIMDNFDMHDFLENIGVDMSKVRWEDY